MLCSLETQLIDVTPERDGIYLEEFAKLVTCAVAFLAYPVSSVVNSGAADKYG